MLENRRPDGAGPVLGRSRRTSGQRAGIRLLPVGSALRLPWVTDWLWGDRLPDDRLPDEALQVSGLCDTSQARAAGGALPSRESGPLVQAAGDAAGEESRSPSPAAPSQPAFLLRGSFPHQSSRPQLLATSQSQEEPLCGGLRENFCPVKGQRWDEGGRCWPLAGRCRG